MQELMSRHKAYALNPRDCLKTTLFQKWQKMVAPPGKKLSEIYLFLFPKDSKKVR
jgi:LIM domain-binding protein 1